MSKLNKIIRVVGMVGLMGSLLVLFDIFMSAYTNPSKTLLIDINVIGESNVEFIIMLVILFCGVYEFFYMLDNFCKQEIRTKGLENKGE